ncbi:PAS domain-containing protein [Sphingomonas hankyongi]|uniref:PAS domain-containing protein n=1 Tax=Sphingomonas hankyongi TaxID=2908209 RepID=A0ABT0S4B6_9SPHN|nr:PAS domain-containing protein [Sphingomonas hankyongi]MCL6730712.1 PAS domain-containing protein [Sphingomonas hankyongi]
MHERITDEHELEAMRASIHQTPIATIVTDNRLDDNPIVEVNAAFEALTGYRPDEILGRNCRFLSGPGTEPESRAALRSAVAQGRPTIVELMNYRKDGTPFRNAVMLAPVLDTEGAVVMFIGSQMEVARADSAAASRRAKALELVDRLTSRQRQILELMASGYRNKQIGGTLGIGEKTVKMHRVRLLQALGVTTSAESIRLAVEAGIERSSGVSE